MAGACRPLTNGNKWMASAVSAIIFALLSSSQAYQITQSLVPSTSQYSIMTPGNCPTVLGLTLHAVLFVLILRLILQFSSSCKATPSKDLWIAALLAGLLFMILGSPFLYQASGKLLSPVGYSSQAENGCPSPMGLLLHAVVFMLIVRLILH